MAPNFWDMDKPQRPINRILRFSFVGNPLILIFVLLVLFLLADGFYTIVKSCIDDYFPYQGIVVEEDVRWSNNFFEDFVPRTHYLILKQSDGTRIVKYVFGMTWAYSFIKKGDYVIKERGITQSPHVKGKRTYTELKEELRKKRMSK